MLWRVCGGLRHSEMDHGGQGSVSCCHWRWQVSKVLPPSPAVHSRCCLVWEQSAPPCSARIKSHPTPCQALRPEGCVDGHVIQDGRPGQAGSGEAKGPHLHAGTSKVQLNTQLKLGTACQRYTCALQQTCVRRDYKGRCTQHNHKRKPPMCAAAPHMLRASGAAQHSTARACMKNFSAHRKWRHTIHRMMSPIVKAM